MPNVVMKIVGGFVLLQVSLHFTCVLLSLLVDKFSHLNHTHTQFTKLSLETLVSTHTYTQSHSNTLKCIGMSMNG